ncbi:MAG: TetR/AcrR family transcriptional regulator [Pseudomonadota bacterium]|nr:TetR/AcrR family transcriptional regulator [Pseudomonadota bacterium]
MVNRKRDTYRHGDLHAAAVAAAIVIVREEGVEALTVRRIAERVGVAHRSLYRHFRDREALLDAVASDGYRRLAASAQKARTPKDFASRYANFALGEPYLYDVMMTRASSTISLDPDLKEATDRLIAASLAVLSDPAADGETRRRQVMRLWMGLHGGVSLHRAGLLRARSNRAFIGELLRILELA